jgi:hypothetical protein
MLSLFLQSLDSCELLIWDDELYEVNAANGGVVKADNGGEQRHATMQVGHEFGKAFDTSFARVLGRS